MVCGKPSIRDALKEDTKDVSESTWNDIETTATYQVGEMAKKVKTLAAELVDLEAKTDAKRKEGKDSELSAEECSDLIKSAFGGTGFPSAAEAKTIDCGYGDDVDYDNMEEYEAQYAEMQPNFEAKADAEIKDAGRAIKNTVFEQACSALIGDEDTTCGLLCYEFTEYAASVSVRTAKNMAGPSLAELVAASEKKRSELKAAENEHTECVESVQTIKTLHDQFVKAKTTLKTQKRSCGRTTRMLKGQQNKLKKVTKEFNLKTAEDKKAQEELREAIALQNEARQNKEDAAENLRMWEEHMRKLKIAIEEQTKVVAQTAEALRIADAASAAVSDFKDKLSTALNGLVDYYDEAVRQPLRQMGIVEEVKIETLFPTPMETMAAKNLQQGLAATKDFCAAKMDTLAKLPEIEASGKKLTSICDGQNWDVVSGEVDAAVTTKRQRAIKNLEIAQQKVLKYTGLLADKAEGEVEGVWKAMAIFGNTDFSTKYLSGWRFDLDGVKKGTKAGYMMELARALKKSRERAAQLWDEAKENLKVLKEEKQQVADILVVAEEYLKEMIAEYEKATKAREIADEKARVAREALLKVTAEKEALEKKVAGLIISLEEAEKEVAQATSDLKKTHETAMGSFMELLHASEKQDGESWD